MSRPQVAPYWALFLVVVLMIGCNRNTGVPGKPPGRVTPSYPAATSTSIPPQIASSTPLRPVPPTLEPGGGNTPTPADIESSTFASTPTPATPVRTATESSTPREAGATATAARISAPATASEVPSPTAPLLIPSARIAYSWAYAGPLTRVDLEPR